jgi:mersacidin/lichenicidin family type 2 lantibiotic
MSHVDIIRAWKDAEYRLSLNEAQRAQLPDHPAGLIELQGTDLQAIAGGFPDSHFRRCTGQPQLLVSRDNGLYKPKENTPCHT